MAIATGTALAVLAATTAATAVAGGMQQKAAADSQANAAEASSIMAAKEQVRTSALQANQEKEAAEDARKQQKLAYLKSGVSLDGSPLMLMEETRLRGASNVDEVTQSGAYGAASSLAEGRTQAAGYQAQGRSALIGGLSGAAQAGASYASSTSSSSGNKPISLPWRT